MTKECLGCGSVLQTIAPKEEGFVKSSVLSKADYCERCFKIKQLCSVQARRQAYI